MNIDLILKRIFRFAGLEVKRYSFLNAEGPLLKKLTKDFNIQTVIDVGANEGQYAMQLLRNGYRGAIYSFEPIAQPYEILKGHAMGNDRWTTIHSAVGSKDEDLVINISENMVSSSLYEVGKTSVSVEPASRIVGKENVKVTSLDTFFGHQSGIKKEILLKLDIQGFELEALKGATRSLEEVMIIQTELSFVPLYIGAPLFSEVVSFLESRGYNIFTILPGFRDQKTGRLLQADGIFVRGSSSGNNFY